MANKLSLITVFLGVVLMLQGVQGWWDVGHMVVSQIALIHLNANSASSPEALLALNNAISALVTYSSASDSFVTAACWMDDLKTRDLNQFNNWHFINLPICDFPNITETDSCNNISVSSILADSKSGDIEDALWAINQGIKTLSSKSALGFERGFALRNLLHIVGDIHQPLHAVNRFSPETPNGDFGGNSFLITGFPYTNKLHGFWDSGAGYLAYTPSRPLKQNDTDFIFNTASSIVAKTASLTANVTTINVTDWAVQSRFLAMSYAYNLTYLSTPSDYYISQAWEVIQNQLGWAGYRLYLLLKDIVPCSDNGNCAAVCTGGCGPNETCTGPEVCTCNTGYNNTNTTGLTCLPVCTGGCGPNELCTAPEACTCSTGYAGPTCSPVCTGGCGLNETCTGPEVCTCSTGYNNTNTTGLTCSPVCSGGCGSSALCVAPETCVCSDSEATYVKGKCEKLVDTSKLVTIDWKYAGIALAAALGVSLLLNIVLCIRSRRNHYNALP